MSSVLGAIFLSIKKKKKKPKQKRKVRPVLMHVLWISVSDIDSIAKRIRSMITPSGSQKHIPLTLWQAFSLMLLLMRNPKMMWMQGHCLSH
jgi:hypothetical protein